MADDGRFAPWVVKQWMDQIEGWDKYLALFASDPYAGDPLAAEIVGGIYARQLSEWIRSSDYALTLSAGLVWRSLVPGTVVRAVGAFDAPFNGNLLFRSLLPEAVEYASGGTYPLPAGEYVVGLDIPVG
jgi:hypothetical protein